MKKAFFALLMLLMGALHVAIGICILYWLAGVAEVQGTGFGTTTRVLDIKIPWTLCFFAGIANVLLGITFLLQHRKAARQISAKEPTP